MRCREIGTFLHCWWKCKSGAATLEDNLVVPQEVKHKLPCDPASIFTWVYTQVKWKHMSAQKFTQPKCDST